MHRNGDDDPSRLEPAPPTPEVTAATAYFRDLFIKAHEHEVIEVRRDLGDSTPPSIAQYVFDGPASEYGDFGTEYILLNPSEDDPEHLVQPAVLDDEAFMKVIEHAEAEFNSDESLAQAVEFLQLVPTRLYRLQTAELPDAPEDDGMIGEEPFMKYARLRNAERHAEISDTNLFVAVFDTSEIDMPLTYAVLDCAADTVRLHVGGDETIDDPNLDGALKATFDAGFDEIESWLTQVAESIEDPGLMEGSGQHEMDADALMYVISQNFSVVPKGVR